PPQRRNPPANGIDWQHETFQQFRHAGQSHPSSPHFTTCRFAWKMLASQKQKGAWFMERTLVLLKPDCVERRLMGRVISRFEEKGLNIIAMKMLRVTPALAKQHYAE